MIEKIIVKGTLLALIIRKNFNKEGVNFITSKESPLQLGVSRYAKNTSIACHVHKNWARYIKTTQEIIYIVEGKARVDLFFKNKKVITKILKPKDSILLMGAHALKFLTNTKIIEIKQGPYIDKKKDKNYLRIK